MCVSYRKHAFSLHAFRRRFLSVVLFPIHIHPSPLQKTLAPVSPHLAPLSQGILFLSQSSPRCHFWGSCGCGVSSMPPELHSTEIWLVRNRLRWNEGQEKHMDRRGSFSQRVGCTPSPASARRVTTWLQAFGVFESQMWEMWGTWILSALPGSLPSTGCREQAHQGTLCQEHRWTVLSGGLGYGTGTLFLTPEAAIQAYPWGTSLCLPRWGAGHLPPLSVSPCV